MVFAEHPPVGRELLVELPQLLVALRDAEINLLHQGVGRRHERPHGLKFLLGWQPPLLRDEQPCLHQARGRACTVLFFHESGDRLLCLRDPVLLDENVGQHEQERSLVRPKAQAFPQIVDGLVWVALLHRHGRESAIDAFVAGKHPAGLEDEFFGSIEPFLGQSNFDVGEEYVRVIGGDRSGLGNVDRRLRKLLVCPVPVGDCKPDAEIVWIHGHELLEHSLCGFLVSKFFVEQGRQQERSLASETV